MFRFIQICASSRHKQCIFSILWTYYTMVLWTSNYGHWTATFNMFVTIMYPSGQLALLTKITQIIIFHCYEIVIFLLAPEYFKFHKPLDVHFRRFLRRTPVIKRPPSHYYYRFKSQLYNYLYIIFRRIYSHHPRPLPHNSPLVVPCP